MAYRVGLLLAGCGAFDGSDIHETVLALLALDRPGVDLIFTAPDMNQRHVVSHITQEEMEVQRNVLEESARIARGNIVDLATLDTGQLDALIVPGGFGPVKNLCEFAFKGPTQAIDPQVRHLLRTLFMKKKPMGAIAMAAFTLAIALADHQPEITVGSNMHTAAAIETIGGLHQECESDQICVDRTNRIVTTPGSLEGTSLKEIAVGVERLVEKILDLIGN